MSRPERNDPAWTDKMIAATEFLVEATSEEANGIWLMWRRAMRVEEVGRGFAQTIGELARRPVCVHVSWLYFEDHLIAFHETTSQVSDSVQVEAWLEKVFPCMSVPWDGSRRRHTNATNFSHALHGVIPDAEWRQHREWAERHSAIIKFLLEGA